MEALLATLSQNSAGKLPGSHEWYAALASVGLATLLGLVLSFFYRRYWDQDEPQDDSLARGLALLTPAMTVTFLVAQASLALSLGLIGSLSFVRFRTQVKRTEDLAFVVMAIATAIACSVSLYAAAIALIAVLGLFCGSRRLLACKRRRSGFAIVTFNTALKLEANDLLATMAASGATAEFVSFRTYDKITSFVFNASSLVPARDADVSDLLRRHDPDAQIYIYHPSERTSA